MTVVDDVCGKCGGSGYRKLGSSTLCRACYESTTAKYTTTVIDPDSADGTADGLHYTDVGNARRFTDLHGHEIRFVANWLCWLVWDGRRWARDAGNIRVTELAKDVGRHLWNHVPDATGKSDKKELIAWAKTSDSARGINAMTHLAAGVPSVLVAHDTLDGDNDKLNVANGTLHVWSGHLDPHDPHDLITKLADIQYDANAQCPRWLAFLERVIPDEEVRAFVQRYVGYCLTGRVTEQTIAFLIGPGANGKSVFLNVLRRLLGEYAVVAPRDLLIAQRYEPHPTSIAGLAGARLASAVETEAGSKLSEAKVKELVGGDDLTARRMREDFWQFEPTHKLIVAANYRPTVTGTDSAIWRRIRVIPFEVVIPFEERNPGLLELLALELPGILNWAVEGCKKWWIDGLGLPSAVELATSQYRDEQDIVGQFLAAEGYELGPGRAADAGELQRGFLAWCETNGVDPMGKQRLAQALRGKGLVDARRKKGRVWEGLGRQNDDRNELNLRNTNPTSDGVVTDGDSSHHLSGEHAPACAQERPELSPSVTPSEPDYSDPAVLFGTKKEIR